MALMNRMRVGDLRKSIVKVSRKMTQGEEALTMLTKVANLMTSQRNEIEKELCFFGDMSEDWWGAPHDRLKTLRDIEGLLPELSRYASIFGDYSKSIVMPPPDLTRSAELLSGSLRMHRLRNEN